MASETSCLLVSTDAEAARAGTDGYTDRQTHDNYRNPRACAPRVNQRAYVGEIVYTAHNTTHTLLLVVSTVPHIPVHKFLQ